MKDALAGKVAIITGGGSGLGAASAIRFVQEGAKVVIAGRRENRLQEVVEKCASDNIKYCVADITKEEDRQRIIDTALSFGEGLHVLVNNAAHGADNYPLAEFPLDVWNDIVDVNLTSPLRMMQLAIPHMLEAGVGSLITISSMAGLGTIPDSLGYCTTKGALINMTWCAAIDYGPKNIRANVVCPGSFMTEMTREGMKNLSGGSDDISLASKYFSWPLPLKRIAEPEEIAGLIVYLASDDSSYMTGAVIPIDGGANIVDCQGASMDHMPRP